MSYDAEAVQDVEDILDLLDSVNNNIDTNDVGGSLVQLESLLEEVAIRVEGIKKSIAKTLTKPYRERSFFCEKRTENSRSFSQRNRPMKFVQ